MSRAVNIHPLAVALSVACGTVLYGVIGAVVAVPLVAVTWTVWTTLRTRPPLGDDNAPHRAVEESGADPAAAI